MLEPGRTTSKFMILVEFLNLTFGPEADIKRVSNVRFIPLVPPNRAGKSRKQG